MGAAMQARKPVIITLTQRARAGESLEGAYGRLVDAWNRLRRSKAWLGSVRGHAIGIETTRNSTAGWWHVHAHVVADADWIEQSELLALWRRSIGSEDERDGGVNIQRAHSEDYLEAAREVAKYVVKGFASEEDDGDSAALDAMSDVEVIELLNWLRGKRLLRTYGAWREVDVDAEPTEDVASVAPEWAESGVMGINALTGEEVHWREVRRVPDGHLSADEWGWLGDLYSESQQREEGQ